MSKIADCYKKTRVLKGRATGKYFAKAVTCGKLTCPLCREQIVATLQTKIMYASHKYGMNQFFTLTTPFGYDELIRNFELLYKKMNNLEKDNFIAKARGKTYEEKLIKYNNKISEIIDFEIKTMFFHRYMLEEIINIARKNGVFYKKLKDKEQYINKNYNELLNRILDHYNSFKSGKLSSFTYKISDDNYLEFNSYNELYNYCHSKITKHEDEKFHYIRILEIAGKPHFHVLTNRYIPHYIMAGLLLGRAKPQIGKRDIIYLNKDLLEFASFNNEIETREAVTKYVTEYITTELGETVDNYKKEYKGKKRLDVIKSSYGIDTALTTKFEEEDEEDAEKYSYVDTYPYIPRIGWEELEGDNVHDYIRNLQFAHDHEPNAYIEQLNESYEQFKKDEKQLKSMYLTTSTEYKKAHKDLKEKFDIETNRVETMFLKEEVDKKIGQKSVFPWISKKYCDDLRNNILEQDYDLADKDIYLYNQAKFHSDLNNPNKKFIFLLGSAGSGKTTTISNIFKYSRKNDLKIEYVALSAKASSVLMEKGLNSATIHRLCGAKFSYTPNFSRNEHNLLDLDIIVIDEISMVSKLVFALLLNALPPHTKIVMLGDPNQINPVGSNNLVFEFEQLKHPAISFSRLNINFRSKGKVAKIANEVKENNFSNIEFKKYNIDEIADLSKKGYTILCNSRRLEKEINLYASKENKDIALTSFYSYEKNQEVMILRNDAKNDIWNGNTAKIKGITERKGKPTIELEKQNGEKFYYSLLKSATHFQPAYSFTIHKSQGSEYDKVAIVLDNKSMLLNNNLLYTAITRAKEDFIIYVTDGVNTELLKQKQENSDVYTLKNIEKAIEKAS